MKMFPHLLLLSSVTALFSTEFSINIPIDYQNKEDQEKLEKIFDINTSKNSKKTLDFLESFYFSKAYLENHFKSTADDDVFEAKMLLQNYFSNKYKGALFEREKQNIDEEMVKSYYYDHLEDFKVDESYTYYTIRFDSKEDAENFHSKFKQKKDISLITLFAEKDYTEYKRFQSIPVNRIFQSDLLILERLEKLELSKPLVSYGDHYILFYTEKLPPHQLELNKVRKVIMDKLISHKIKQIITTELKKLTNP